MSKDRPAIGDRFQDRGSNRVVEIVSRGRYPDDVTVRNVETGRHSDIKRRYLKERWTFVEPVGTAVDPAQYANELPVSRRDFDALADRVWALEVSIQK